MSANTRRDELRQTYHAMTNEQLEELALDADSLDDEAFAVLRNEVHTRGLTERVKAYTSEIELNHFREYCKTFSDSGLQLLAVSGNLREQWEQEEMNHQLEKRGLEKVEHFPEPSSAESSDNAPLSCVGNFRDLPNAQVAKSVLDSSGIPCFLADENTIRIDWMWSYALGRIKLMVRDKDEDAAREMLASAEDTGGDVETGDGDGK